MIVDVNVIHLVEEEEEEEEEEEQTNYNH